jgi:hypothetical protein
VAWDIHLSTPIPVSATARSRIRPAVVASSTASWCLNSIPHHDAIEPNPYPRLAKRGHALRATRAVSSQVHVTVGTQYFEQTRSIATLSNAMWLATILSVSKRDSLGLITGKVGARRTLVSSMPWSITFSEAKGSSGSTKECHTSTIFPSLKQTTAIWQMLDIFAFAVSTSSATKVPPPIGDGYVLAIGGPKIRCRLNTALIIWTALRS